MEHGVRVTERPALRVVARRMPVMLEAMGEVLARAFGEAEAIVAAGEAGTADPPFVIYHAVPTPGEPIDIEVCVPVAHAIEAREPWRLEELPAGTFASTLHIGPHHTVAPAYGALTAWIAANGLAIAGPPREVYLSEPSTPPERIRMVVEFPVSRIPIAIA